VAKPNDESLVAGLELQAATGKQGLTIYDLLDKQRTAIEKALPNVGITAEQLVRIITTQIRINPRLGECTPQSLLGAVMLCAQLGLEPGPLGQAYFVPFMNNKTGKLECTFMVGYKGIVRLAHREGGVVIAAHTVRVGDSFGFDYGEGWLKHTYELGATRGEIRGCYSRVLFPNGLSSFYVLDKKKIDEHRKRSKAGGDGPWVTDYDAMARKTAVRVHGAQLPLGSSTQRALAADETALAFDDVDGVIASTEQAPVVDVEAVEITEEQENADV
jgi:recombination protein RecT